MLNTKALIQIKKLSWLLLGFCFIVLYSCPVKKYLLLTYCNGRATETQALQFQKDVYSHAEKIVYLRRQSARSILIVAGRAVRPSISPEHCLFATDRDISTRAAIGRAIVAYNRAVEGAPPLWLGAKRLLI